ncbi:predicted protein, partial [Nematostella vectensis]
PPTITFAPTNTTVTEGSPAVLHCNATGIPNPVIDWVGPRGQNLSPGSTFPFPNITRNDAGLYNCRARNKVGVVISQAYIDVLYTHHTLFPDPPVAHVRPATLSVQEGASVVSLSCDATGNPSPRVQWRKSGSDAVISSQKVLVLQNLTRLDAGVYQCTAS